MNVSAAGNFEALFGFSGTGYVARNILLKMLGY